MDKYKIIRYYFHGDKRTIKNGLTLEQAQTHCQSSETSSSTCKLARNKARTKVYGDWFDGYEHES